MGIGKEMSLGSQILILALFVGACQIFYYMIF